MDVVTNAPTQWWGRGGSKGPFLSMMLWGWREEGTSCLVLTLAVVSEFLQPPGSGPAADPPGGGRAKETPKLRVALGGSSPSPGCQGAP